MYTTIETIGWLKELYYRDLMVRVMDQTRRHAIETRTFFANEKLVLFEPHTDIIKSQAKRSMDIK